MIIGRVQDVIGRGTRNCRAHIAIGRKKTAGWRPTAGGVNVSDYICKVHNAQVPKGQACAQCIEDFKTRRDTLLMTTDERADELRRWADNVLTISFGDMQGRFEELLGRPVWTHEMVMIDALAAEILSGERVGIAKVIKRAGPNTIVVLTEPAPEEAPNDSD